MKKPSTGVSGDVDVVENQYQVGGYRIFADDEEGAFPIAFLNAASADSGFTAAYFCENYTKRTRDGS